MAIVLPMILVTAMEFTVTVSRHAPFSPDCPNASSSGVTVEREHVDTAIRLIGGCNNHSGELQIKYINQDWSSVCYDHFNYFDAQFACSFLGFPFVASIYKISAQANSLGFAYNCSGADLADGVTRISGCSALLTQSPCSSYAGVVCDTDHSPSDGYVAIAWYGYGTRFYIIAPDNGVFFDDCYSLLYGFCHGVYFAHKNDTQLEALVSSLSQPPSRENGIKLCGDHLDLAYRIGMNCEPVPGDPVLTNVYGINLEGLVWYYDGMFGWVHVCNNGMGYIEAQVLCNSIDFPYFTYLQPYNQSPTQSTVISSIECTGSEERLADCHMNFINTNDTQCTNLTAVGCGGVPLESINDRAVIVFDDPPEGQTAAPLTIIVPVRGLYLTNCSTVILESDNFCPGMHLVDGNNSGLQSVYLDPQNCQGVEYRLFGIDCTPATVLPDTVNPDTTLVTVATVTDLAADSSSAGVLVVSLSVCGVLIAIIGLAAVGVTLWIGWKRIQSKRLDKERREIIKDLEERNNSVKSSLSENGIIQMRKYHRSIIRRRSSATHHRLENENWEIPFECITLGEELGSGAYGTIQKGVIDCCHQDESIDVAVKLLKKYASQSERRSLMQEIDMMKDIGYHRHVVCMLACCTQGSTIALVMEFMPYGNLQTFLKKHRDPEVQESTTVGSLSVPNPYVMGGNSTSLSTFEQQLSKSESKLKEKYTLSLTEQLQFARQITLGMEYLSGMKIVHRDLATRNVLIDEEMFLKVCDFGLSRDIYSDNSYHMAHTKDKLPVRWMAVESIIDREFSVASDVWSFGIVLWEIMTCGSFPYYHMSNSEVIEGIKDGYRLSKPNSCPQEVYDIMSTCWQKIPSQRPSFTDIRGMIDSLLDKGEYTSLM